MAVRGWITLSRKIQDHWLWQKNKPLDDTRRRSQENTKQTKKEDKNERLSNGIRIRTIKDAWR